MVLFQPLILYSSIVIGIDAGILTILFTNAMKNTYESKDWSESERNKNALLSVIWFGVAYVIGILCLGKMVDKFGMRKMCLINTGIVVTAFLGLIVFNEMQTFYLWASSLVCFFWGINEAATLLCISTMCGF